MPTNWQKPYPRKREIIADSTCPGKEGFVFLRDSAAVLLDWLFFFMLSRQIAGNKKAVTRFFKCFCSPDCQRAE